MFISEDCTEVQVCVAGEITVTGNRPRCHEQATCKANPESEGQLMCTCNAGMVGDGINSCERKQHSTSKHKWLVVEVSFLIIGCYAD